MIWIPLKEIMRQLVGDSCTMPGELNPSLSDYDGLVQVVISSSVDGE